MIEVHRQAAQGDVLFRRIPALPDDVREHPQVGELVLAHSESGHHHTVDSARALLFEPTTAQPFVRFLVVEAPFADVLHRRPETPHETLRLARGVWEVRRQREWIPEPWRERETVDSLPALD